jgi:hypothetical protein
MLSKIIFKQAFWSLFIMGVLNWIAYKLNWYWTLARVDTVVHFFGGLTVALATLWLCSLRFDTSKWSIRRLFLVALISSITVGILWEFYELYFGITSLSDGIYYVTDNGLDVIMDTVGGIAGFFYVRNLLRSRL